MAIAIALGVIAALACMWAFSLSLWPVIGIGTATTIVTLFVLSLLSAIAQRKGLVYIPN